MDESVNLVGELKRVERTSKKTGKTSAYNMRMDWTGDDLIVSTSAKDAAQTFAQLWLGVVREQFDVITERPSLATIARRRGGASKGRAAKPLQKKWNSASPIPEPQASNPSGPVWVDTGRLRDSMVVALRESSEGRATCTINVAGNRLDPRTFGGGEDALIKAVLGPAERPLVRYVPALLGRLDGAAKRRVEDGLVEMLASMLGRTQEEIRRKRAALARVVVGVVRTVVRG